MNNSNIKINYLDTPEKLYSSADEVISFLVEHLRTLNDIANKYARLEKQVYAPMSELRSKLKLYQAVKDKSPSITSEIQKLEEQLNQGVRINGVRIKDEQEVWRQYKADYGQAVSAFCTEELLSKGYAQSLCCNQYGNEYSYLNYGCELAITMKSTRRAIIEASFKDYPSNLSKWNQFTLISDSEWHLDKVKYKFNQNDRWVSMGV